jgi:hypothetical protein
MKSRVITIVVSLFLLLIILIIIGPTWFKDYRRLSAVRKTSPNYLKATTFFDKTVVFETNIDMTPDKLYFHNPYPRLVICLNKKKYTRDNIAELGVNVELLDEKETRQEKCFNSTNFKYVEQDPKHIKDFEKFICFYPVGNLKLSLGYNRYKVVINGLTVMNTDDLQVLLYFHETTNTMILLKPIKYIALLFHVI